MSSWAVRARRRWRQFTPEDIVRWCSQISPCRRCGRSMAEASDQRTGCRTCGSAGMRLDRGERPVGSPETRSLPFEAAGAVVRRTRCPCRPSAPGAPGCRTGDQSSTRSPGFDPVEINVVRTAGYGLVVGRERSPTLARPVRPHQELGPVVTQGAPRRCTTLICARPTRVADGDHDPLCTRRSTSRSTGWTTAGMGREMAHVRVQTVSRLDAGGCHRPPGRARRASRTLGKSRPTCPSAVGPRRDGRRRPTTDVVFHGRG